MLTEFNVFLALDDSSLQGELSEWLHTSGFLISTFHNQEGHPPPPAAAIVAPKFLDTLSEKEREELLTSIEDAQVIYVSEPRPILEVEEAVRKRLFWWVTSELSLEEWYFLTAKACITHEIYREHAFNRTRSVHSHRHTLTGGHSTTIQKLNKRIAQVTQAEDTVLLTGESGTGKTLLARSIHDFGPRSSKPFFILSCAAIPADLLEAELFGYTKGAFTGALGARAGCFEAANGGTIFLDEIGELPLALQPKLLSTLQDRTVRRLGSNENFPIDVRIIAATNRDLQEMCTEGSFRDDLYYRLNVLPLHIPPLRERLEDLEILIPFIMNDLNLRSLHESKTLSPEALQKLSQYNWPGNIRQLENVLRRAVIFSDSAVITADEIEIEAIEREVRNPGVSFPSLAGLSLAAIEQEAIQQTLEYCQNKKPKAAEMLGISLKSLYNKLNRYEG